MITKEWVFDKENFTGTAKAWLFNGICPIKLKDDIDSKIIIEN